LEIIVHFTFQRSMNTPAIGLMKANGARNETRIRPTWFGVPCKSKVTTLKTAKIARKSPKMLTIWAIHRLRTGRTFKTSRNDNAVGGGVLFIWHDLSSRRCARRQN